MFERKSVAGRRIRSISLYGADQMVPKYSSTVEDGTNVTVSLVSKQTLECKLTRDESGERIILDEYEVPIMTSYKIFFEMLVLLGGGLLPLALAALRLEEEIGVPFRRSLGKERETAKHS